MLPRFSHEFSSEVPKAMPARRPPPRATSCIAFFYEAPRLYFTLPAFISVSLNRCVALYCSVDVSLYRCKNHGFARSVALRLPSGCAPPCKALMSWIRRDACRAIPKLCALALRSLRSLRRGTGPVLKLSVSTLLLSCCLYCRSLAPSPVVRPTHVSVVLRFRWGYALLFYCSWILLRRVSLSPLRLSRAP